MQVFFSDKDPIAEAQILLEVLSQWLGEQPEQPGKRGKASFKYGTDGNLRTVNVVLLDEEK